MFIFIVIGSGPIGLLITPLIIIHGVGIIGIDLTTITDGIVLIDRRIILHGIQTIIITLHL